MPFVWLELIVFAETLCSAFSTARRNPQVPDSFLFDLPADFAAREFGTVDVDVPQTVEQVALSRVERADAADYCAAKGQGELDAGILARHRRPVEMRGDLRSHQTVKDDVEIQKPVR